MDERTLLQFVERILEKSPDSSAGIERIAQLCDILEEQGADKQLADLLNCRDSYFFDALQDIRRSKRLERGDFEVARMRAQQRREQEEMMRHYGRC